MFYVFISTIPEVLNRSPRVAYDVIKISKNYNNKTGRQKVEKAETPKQQL